MSRTFDSSQTGANAEVLITPESAVYNNLAAFTLSAWVYPTSVGGSDAGTIIVKDPDNAYSHFLEFNGNSSGLLAAGVATTGISASSISAAAIPFNTWTHVAVTFNLAGDAIAHIYINGVESTATPTAATGTIADNSATGFYFGNDGFDDGWNGSLAEIAVWDNVLTGPQLAALAASTAGAAAIDAAHLVGYWHLCGTMSPEPDVTVNGNNAVLSTTPPTQGANSPGFSCGAAPSAPIISIPMTTNEASIDAFGAPFMGTLNVLGALIR